jgi:predicted nucleic acid-binding protein
MCPFADSTFFVALINKNDNDHIRAKEIFVDIFYGKMKRPETNDYVLDETVTTVRARTKRHEDAINAMNMILKSKYVDYIKVTDAEIKSAAAEYSHYSDKDLSFTDWVITSYMKRKGITLIIAFDKHFDQMGFDRIC